MKSLCPDQDWDLGVVQGRKVSCQQAALGSVATRRPGEDRGLASKGAAGATEGL